MTDLQALKPRIQERIEQLRQELNVVGYVAGVYHAGAMVELASGTANRNTGVEMTTDTAFLLGSVTKVLVTTLVMRYVDRGALSLDDRVVERLPELQLADAETRDALTVRNLLNHTSGIDAADFAPDFGRGPQSVRRYVASLADKRQVHPLGAYPSYCNPGFIIAGRMLEFMTGQDFDSLLKHELFETVDMANSCTSGDEAILRRTAVGHFLTPGTSEARATERFMLPYSMAPAGSTVITTVSDLVRFGRIHLDAGRTPDGDQIISSEAVDIMATETVASPALNVTAVGVGWLLPAFGTVKMLAHTGGSYGGVSQLMVLPEHDFILVGFGNSVGAGAMHDRLSLYVLQELLDLPAQPPIEQTVTSVADPEPYIGSYEQLGVRSIFSAEAGELVMRIEFQYSSEEEQKLHAQYRGTTEVPPIPLEPVTDALFKVKGQSLDTFTGPYGRAALISFLDPEPARGGQAGRFRHRHYGMRIARRID